MIAGMEVRADRVYSSASSEFEQHRLAPAGGGYFITRDDIRRRAPVVVSDMMRGIPAVRVVPTDGMRNAIVMARGVGGAGLGCRPTLFLNGMRIAPGDDDVDLDTFVRPNEIEGIAIYPSAAQTPAEYQSRHACGTIVIWMGAPPPRLTVPKQPPGEGGQSDTP